MTDIGGGDHILLNYNNFKKIEQTTYLGILIIKHLFSESLSSYHRHLKYSYGYDFLAVEKYKQSPSNRKFTLYFCKIRDNFLHNLVTILKTSPMFSLYLDVFYTCGYFLMSIILHKLSYALGLSKFIFTYMSGDHHEILFCSRINGCGLSLPRSQRLCKSSRLSDLSLHTGLVRRPIG